MLHPDDIARLCLRKYPAFLKALVTGQPFFPLDIRFGRPATTEGWEKLRQEISALATGNLGYRIEWAETNTRRWGRQKFPDRVWFENERDFLVALRKSAEVERLRLNLTIAGAQCPQLAPWLSANAMRVVEYADVWPDLLKVCRYFLKNPRPGLYSRELPVEVETKFVERHEGILRSLLDFLLPDSAKIEADRFEARFGLRYDEPLIRFRLLDSGLKARLGLLVDDVAVPLSQFRRLDCIGLNVLITENKMTFLTLPPASEAIGIWGGGGAAELLASVEWLAGCRLFYWGDLDVHGFHILSRLRQTFPGISSLMMNERTLDLFANLAVPAREATYQHVSGLTSDERLAYHQVGSKSLLLEQEKIPHAHAVREILSVLGAKPASTTTSPGMADAAVAP
ncbi:MAG TPA: DUF3322 domain-containing protein [Verrucomicrobiae bacterium]